VPKTTEEPTSTTEKVPAIVGKAQVQASAESIKERNIGKLLVKMDELEMQKFK
jgi:hypothetical protein